MPLLFHWASRLTIWSVIENYDKVQDRLMEKRSVRLDANGCVLFDQARQRGGQRGASAPPVLHLGSRGSKSALFEMQLNPYLDIDMIQRKSNKLYKQAKYYWKREQVV